MKLNIVSGSSDWRGRALSNFSTHSFVLDGKYFASVEGFIQGIKFPESDPRRQEAFSSVGIKAKRLGRKAKPILKRNPVIEWQGRAIPFRSKEHFALIERAIRAKFEQNQPAMKALVATKGMELVHDTGYPESPHTSLPAKEFLRILYAIRKENVK